MQEEILYVVAISGALTEAIKRALPEQYKRFIPLVSMLVGLVANMVLTNFAWQDPNTYLLGILGGAGAAGLYDVGSKTILKR